MGSLLGVLVLGGALGAECVDGWGVDSGVGDYADDELEDAGSGGDHGREQRAVFRRWLLVFLASIRRIRTGSRCEMGGYLFLFGVAAILWLAFSVSSLLKEFRAFHGDYRRVHGLTEKVE